MAVSIILLRLWVQLDHRVNTHDSDTSLDGTLELLDLAHARLENTSLKAVVDPALGQVKTVVAVGLLLGDGLLFLVGVSFLHALRESVADTELSNEIRGVLGGVNGQSLGDNEQRLGKLANGKLFPRALERKVLVSIINNLEENRDMSTYHRDGKFFKVDVKSRLNGTSSRDNAVAFQGPLNSAKGVVDRALHLIQTEVIGSTEDNGSRCVNLGTLHEDALIV